MKKIFILFLLTAFLIFASANVSMVSACGYKDHFDCKVTETIVEGRIYFADNNQSAGNSDVTITCVHNGTSYTKNTDSANSGFLKGTYFVLFPQSQCVAGDEVRVSAVKGGSSGEEEGTIKNWITKRCLDIDIGIINVALIPEFGVIVGVLTLVGAVGMFFVVRRK
jgi:hypothetical protein